jgi:Glycosyl hydrolase family 115
MNSINRTMVVAIFAVIICSMNGALAASNVKLDGHSIWIVSPDEPEAVQRALRDVESDWYKVLGRLPTILDKAPKKWDGTLVFLGTKTPKALISDTFPGPESFSLRVQSIGDGAAVVAAGADMRGAIYAAYALSEELLGVDPWYYWVDKEPEYKGSVQVPLDYHKSWGPPSFKYRGWFINDEDLLFRFAPDPMRENIFSLQMWDRIYETMLRLRGNTFIPGTFTFTDERCQVLAHKRGLINSQHHISVVGLNTFQWPDGIPYSYHKHPEILEKMWKQCIDSMADREVIWTVGYRGKHDRPFWRDDKSLSTPEARGKVISDAIAKQVELIQQVQPNADIISNLWMEGVEMYKQGHIKLPEGVTLVWPDDGTGIIRDHGMVKAGQGTYYHTAMMDFHRNQLTEMVPPSRIHQELGRYVKAEATTYFVVNISDVRPVPLSTDYAMRMAWDATTELAKSPEQAMKDCLLEWSAKQLGGDVAAKVADIYKRYYDIPYMRHENGRYGESSVFTRMRSLMRMVASDVLAKKAPNAKALKRASEYAAWSGGSYDYTVPLHKDAELLKSEIPESRRQFYQAHVLTQVDIHLYACRILQRLSEAVLALGENNKQEAIAKLDDALLAYDALFASLREAEYGRWRGWYAGEQFANIYTKHNDIMRFRARLTGETPPTARRVGYYPELCSYQKVFTENFPLMYPAE